MNSFAHQRRASVSLDRSAPGRGRELSGVPSRALRESSPEPLDLADDGRVLGPRLGRPRDLVGVVVREEPTGFGIVRQAPHDLLVPDADHDDAPVPGVRSRGVDEDRGSVRYRRFSFCFAKLFAISHLR